MSLEILTLRDEQAGTSARILPGFGFNCYSFQAQLGGEPVEVLWSAPGFENGGLRASHSGIPILFPFAGRLRGGEIRFAGRTYTVGELDDHRGNAIHGYVIQRPWRVLESRADRAVGQFHAAEQAPEMLDRWPADYLLTVSYELRGNRLRSELRVANPDKRPLPFGLGTHPYFRVPLVPLGQADSCRVNVPAREYWTLENMLPSGRRQAVEGALDLRAGLPFGETELDHVFTALKLEPGANGYRASIEDPLAKSRLTITFDRAFSECVVYNPPHREAICIEPYTCVPDAFALAEQGIETGLRILAPGEELRTWIEIELAAAT